MDVSDETFAGPGNADSGNLKNPSLTSDEIVCDFDNGDPAEEDKSVCTMKKIYSIEGIAFDLISAAKTDARNKSDEKLVKNGKLFRTSSTTLERDRARNELDLSETSSGSDRENGKSGNDLFLLDILDMKKYALCSFIQENPKAADLKWSLFCAACHSYRYDSVLRPFPPMFVEGDVKNIDRLRDVAESCPSIGVLYEQIRDRNSNAVSIDLVNLLYWVLIRVREPQLEFVPEDMHGAVLSKVTSASTAATPKYIFRVVRDKHSEVEKFEKMARKKKIIHAFHGSRLDNFYSILNYGLGISFDKLRAFGPGIYLSGEMNVSLSCSQSGFGWGGSYFGSQISVVALCEMVDQGDVKYSSEKKSVPDSMPGKYFIVRSSDLIRVKYLLVYCDNFPECDSHRLSAVVDWLRKNKVVAVVMAYVVLLMAIATSGNSSIYKYYKRAVRKVGFRVLKL